MPKPLSSRLTDREYVRVARETTRRIGYDSNRTKAEYLAELETTARQLYPNKLKES